MVTDGEKTSIQISVSIRNILREFCDENGLKMNRFVEKAILSSISGSIYKSINYETNESPS